MLISELIKELQKEIDNNGDCAIEIDAKEIGPIKAMFRWKNGEDEKLFLADFDKAL